MQLQHPNVKLFVEPTSTVESAALIPVFHRWIQEGGTDELLIDVADYRHVPQGPGVLLIGHEVDYALDESGGRRGLLVNRKAAQTGDNRTRLRDALRAALQAVLRLEAEQSLTGLRFSRDELRLTVNDRLLAPNTPQHYAALVEALRPVLEELLPGTPLSFEQTGEARERLSVTVRTTMPFDAEALLARLQNDAGA